MTSTDEFFNQQFGDSVNAMSEDEMMGMLKDLVGTHHWIAILKYHRMRRAVALGSLCTIDPVKDTTLIARTQGGLSGLSDLEEMVFRLNAPEVRSNPEED